MSKVFAYMRVSTCTQTTENQRKEILDSNLNITEWFVDHGVSGMTSQKDRKAFMDMLNKTEEGTMIVMTKLDRLGRDAADIMNTMKDLRQRKLKVIILQFGQLDITSPAGRLMVSMLSAVAEMEMDLLKERIHSGLARAKDEGVVMGAPTRIKPDVLRAICKAKAHGDTLDMISKRYDVDRATASRNIRKWKDNLGGYEQEFNSRLSHVAIKAEKLARTS